MKRGFGLVKKARENLELARKNRGDGNAAVAALLYAKAVDGIMRAIYLDKTGRSAPLNASVEFLASKTALPIDAEEYISSVMETEDQREEIESMDVDVSHSRRRKTESTLLYLDGLAKRLLDSAYI